MGVPPTSSQSFVPICPAVFDANMLDWKCEKETENKTRLQIFSGENERYQLDFTLETVIGTMVITLLKDY